jgi:hypothetical protein
MPGKGINLAPLHGSLCILTCANSYRAAYEKAGFGVVKTENLGDDCELVFMTKSIEE